MKKQLLVGAALLAAIPGAATAADLSRPAPAPAPVYTKAPPPMLGFNWTGFYVGGNVGGAWSNSNWADTLDPGVNFGNNNNNNGVFIGGGQVGFNYQFSNIVLGVEGDFDWAANNNTTTGVAAPFAGGNLIAVTSNNKYISTLTGRLGVAVDHFLFYGKGGGAWVGNNNFTVSNLTTGATITGGSNTNTGWDAGVGLEWAFANNWTAKVEYNYIGLSAQTFTVPAGSAFLAGDTFTSSSNHLQTVTFGINYLFNLGGPVMARY